MQQAQPIEGETRNGITFTAEFNGSPIYRCADCKEWAYLSGGGIIRHSSRCDTPKAQFASAASTASASPTRLPAKGLRRDDAINRITDDERFDAYKRGDISESEAMNTDF